jgi:hypothetical protein
MANPEVLGRQDDDDGNPDPRSSTKLVNSLITKFL